MVNDHDVMLKQNLYHIQRSDLFTIKFSLQMRLYKYPQKIPFQFNQFNWEDDFPIGIFQWSTIIINNIDQCLTHDTQVKEKFLKLE